MASPVQRLLASLLQGGTSQVALVHGDLVLAEPAALEVAAALAERHGGQVESYRRPPSLPALLQDLRTFSLFGAAKVVLAIDTAIFADRSGAADLIDDAEEALPAPRPAGAGGAASARKSGGAKGKADARSDDSRDGGEEAAPAESVLSARERLAASRLLQA